MNIFNPLVSGSLSVSGSGRVSGDFTVLGTLFATISGTAENAISTSHAARYTLSSSFEQFTGSYTTGAFTGSFTGDGNGLFNIPASGVTGLNLSQISEGSATASISQTDGLLINTNTQITGNLTVTGRLTAQEYHTELVSASIIYESGSTKFGDSIDDTHEITGSVDVSGSLKINNVNLVSDRMVTVSVTDSGGKYFINNVRNPQLTLVKGFTYKFLFPNIGSHPLKFSTTNDGTHNGGSIYSTGVTTGSTPDYIQIEVTDSTPSTLYYFCTAHIGMGNGISVSSDILNIEADRGLVYIEPSRIATTGSNAFTGSEIVSGSLTVTGSVNITGSISLNGQAIGTGKLNETEFYSYTSSNDTRVSALEISSGSLEGKVLLLETSTGSLNTFTSSINTTIKDKLNNDSVISGSIQVEITGTTGYSTFSSSIATTDSNQEGRLTNIETSTSSLNSFSASSDSRLSALETASGSVRTDFNSYTSSNDSTNTTQNSKLTSLETSTGSLNSFTSSTNDRLISIESSTGSINTFTSSATSTLSSLETASGSIRTDFNSYTSSNDSTNTTQNNRLNSLESASGSIRSDFNSYTSSNDSNNSTQNSRLGNIETSTGSLNSFTSSIDTTIKDKLNNDSVISGSIQVNVTETTGYSTFSSSIATTDLNQNNRLNSIEGKTGSYATTGSNGFNGNQSITGSLIITQDLQVLGSSSIVYSTASQLIVEDNVIIVNASYPAERFAGIEVHDSGSNGSVTASLFWDGLNNRWIYRNTSDAHYGGGMFIAGPRNTGSLGDEPGLTNGKLPKAIGGDHIGDSIMNETNGVIYVTGSLSATGTVYGTNITAIETSTASLNTYTSSLQSAIELTGSNLTVKGDLLVKGTTTNVNTTTLDVDNNLINLNGTGATSAGLRVKDTTGPNQVSGSLLWDATNDYWIAGPLGSEQRIVRETEFNNAVTRIGNVETSTGSLNSFTSSINTTIKNKLNNDGVVSGSSQISFNGITDKPTLVSGSSQITYGSLTGIPSGIVSGSSQISFNTISDKPTLVSGSSQISFNGITDKPALVSGSSQITYGLLSGIPTGIVSGSSQISFGSISSIPSGLVSGSSQISYTGLSNIPSGILSGSAQVIAALPSGTVSGSAQLTSTFVQKAGDTMSGQLIVGSTGTGNSPTLRINNSSASSFNHSIEALAANTTAGQTNLIVLGVSGSTKNAGYLGYNWSSAASNSNYVSLGHWGADNLLRVYGDGTVYMGTVTTGVWNGTAIGDAYISSATNWNTAYNKRPSSLGFTSSTVTLTLGDASTITASVPTFNQNTTGYAMSLNGYVNQTIYTILDGPANGPVIKVRYDSATANRYIDIGSKDGNGVYSEGLKLYNGSTMTWIGNTVYHSGNLTNLNQLTNGPGYITGNQSISISGDASGSGTTSISLTVSSIQGRAFRNTGSNEGVNANSLDANGTTYVTNVDGSSTNLTGNATDGALYSQVYSSSWQHQIYGDYRTGIMYARGKNNGTWQSWKRVALSNSTTFSNVSSVSFTHNLGTANLTAQVFDTSNNMFFPSEINITSTTVTVTFAANRSGRLVVTG